MRRRIVLVLPLLTYGCVSLNSVKSEKEFSAPPDPAGPCSYQWRTGEVLFRSENVYSYAWGPPAAFGYGATQAPGGRRQSQCAQLRTRPDATVSVYYLQYVNKTYTYGLWLPMAAATGYTAGFIPIPTFRHYAVCVQATSDEGLNRYAIARGQIDSLQNVWGGTDTRFHRGATGNSRRVTRILEDLAEQAWHKLWLVPRENLGEQDCQQKLEALLRQPGLRDDGLRAGA